VDLAEEVLLLLSKQQEEISYVRTRSELSAKAAETMRNCFDCVQSFQEKAGDGSLGDAKASGPMFLTLQAKELLKEMRDAMKVKVVGDMIMTGEGRSFLKSCKCKNSILLAHVKTAELIEECQHLQREIQKLDDRLAIESGLRKAKSQEHRVELLRQEVSRLQRIVATARQNAGHEQLDSDSETDVQAAVGKSGKGLLKAQVTEKTLPFGMAGSSKHQQLQSWIMDVSDEVAQQLQVMTDKCEKSQAEIQLKKKIVVDAIHGAKCRAAAEEADKKLGLINMEQTHDIDWKEQIQQASDELQNARAKLQKLDAEEQELVATLKNLNETQSKSMHAAAKTASKKRAVEGGRRRFSDQRKPTTYAVSDGGSAATRVATNSACAEADADGTTAAAVAKGANSAAGAGIVATAVPAAVAGVGAESAPVPNIGVSTDGCESKDLQPADANVKERTPGKTRKAAREKNAMLSREVEQLRGESAVVLQEIEQLKQKLSMLQAQQAEAETEVVAATEAEAEEAVSVPAAAEVETEAAAGELVSSAEVETEAAAVATPKAEEAVSAPVAAAEKVVNSAPPPQVPADKSKVPVGNLVLWIQPSQADSGPTVCLVPLPSATSGGSPSLTNDLADPITRESAQEQLNDMLVHQNETVMLQKQIEQVEKRMRAARQDAIRYGRGANRNAFLAHAGGRLPEQNRILRKEVAARQQELQQLRKEWWAMRRSDSSKRSLPDHCQSLVKALLHEAPSTPEPATPWLCESVPEHHATFPVRQNILSRTPEELLVQSWSNHPYGAPSSLESATPRLCESVPEHHPTAKGTRRPVDQYNRVRQNILARTPVNLPVEGQSSHPYGAACSRNFSPLPSGFVVAPAH